MIVIINFVENRDIKILFGFLFLDKIVFIFFRLKRIDFNFGGGIGKIFRGMRLYVFFVKLF